MKTGVEPDEKAIVIEAFSSVSKRLGRPKIDPKTEDANRKALGREPRPGILKIAKELGIGTSTVQRIACSRHQKSGLPAFGSAAPG